MTTDLLTLFDADEATMRKHVAEALSGADDGELFIEHAQAEALTFDNGLAEGRQLQHRTGFRPARRCLAKRSAMPMPAISRWRR